VRLDCSTPESALDSLGTVLGLQEAELRRFATRELDWGHPELFEGRVLLNAFGLTDDTVPQPDAVRWFHATRVPRGTDFAVGILPFNRAYDEVIWPSLRALGEGMVGADKWAEFAAGLSTSKSTDAHRLYLKRRDGGLWQGPFAHLLRQRAVEGYELPDHRTYTVAPEMVEELAREFEDRFHLPLLEAYQATTGPCIVSFTQENPDRDVIGKALGYVYLSLRAEDPPRWCDPCFSGRGEAVPKAIIDDIVWL
jgi:hypothetical protein